MKKILFVLWVMLLFSMGCVIQNTPEELQDVDVRLKWLHQAQFAGFYVAEEKGFYEENGINVVELAPFDYTNYPIYQVENKEVDFGVTAADELVLARADGNADHVKAIAVIYKINPVCLYSLKESGILKPEDLIGKKIGIERASDGTEINVGILYMAMMSRLGIDRDQITEITIGYDATELLAGDTDVSTGYIINEPHQVIELGKEVNTILPAEYGVNMYADVIIVHDDLIESNPELVESFLRATLQGWQYAIENEEEAVDYVLKYATDRTRSHESYMLRQSIPLIHTGDSELGMMNKEEWENVREILSEQGILQSEIEIEEVYTLQFLESIYDGE